MILLTQMENKLHYLSEYLSFTCTRKSLNIFLFKFRCILFVMLRGAAGTNLFGTPATDLTSNSGNTPPVQTYRKKSEHKKGGLKEYVCGQ